MFECKHCHNCFFAGQSKLHKTDIYKWCVLKRQETSISNSCCHHRAVVKEGSKRWQM